MRLASGSLMLEGMSRVMKFGFGSACTALWSLTSSAGVVAQDIPKDEGGFTEFVTGQIRAEVGDARVAGAPAGHRCDTGRSGRVVRHGGAGVAVGVGVVGSAVG